MPPDRDSLDSEDVARLFRTLFEHSPDGVLITKPDGTIVRANPAACAMLGRTEAEVLRAGRDELVVNDDRLRSFLRERSDRGNAHGELTQRRKDGSTYPVEATSAVLPTTRGEYSYVIFRDVTKQRRESEALQRYQLLARHAHDIILFVTPDDGRIVDANLAAIAAYRYSLDELRGLTIRELRAPETLPVLSAQLHTADTASARFETMHQRKDGTTFPVEVSAEGAEIGGSRLVVSVIRDISERRRAQSRFAALFTSSRDGLTIVQALRDVDGTVVDWQIADANESALRNVALRRDQFVGRSALEVFPHLAASRSQWEQVLATGMPHAYERSFRGHDYLINVYRLDADSMVISAVDVTPIKQAERDLRESDRRKSEFLGVLSHELRNPLAPIRNGIQILEQVDPAGPQGRHAVDVLRRQTQHLSRLVDDLLDSTRIARGKIELRRERLDAAEVVRRTADDHRSIFADRSIALRVDARGPAFVDADPTRLAQIVGNLLQNAARFSDPGSTTEVSVATHAGAVEIRVRDGGIGIDAGEIDKMFEPFAQADNTLARTRGGLGLGLALVRGLVELHGGTVRGESAGRGHGATFTVTLPQAPAPAVRAFDAKEPVAAARPRTVLLIEDNLDAGDTLRELLELSGHRAEVARDGRSGIEMARALRPDVILCDIGLPDLSGYDVARALRNEPLLTRTKLVALSGYAQSEDRERAREAGFEAHLAKPPSLTDLERVLST